MRGAFRLFGLAAFIVLTNVVTVVLLTGGAAISDGPPPCVAGDVNGDGVVDVSDPEGNVFSIEHRES